MKRSRVLILSFALFLFVGKSTSHALTAQDVINRARTYVKDQQSQTSRQTFSDATLLSFLNDAQREANAFAWVLQASTTFVLTGGTTEYVLPTDFVATQRVLFNNLKMDQTSLAALDADSSGWRNSSGKPFNYYLYYTTITLMGFYPAPTTTSTGTVIVYYVQQPTELTLTTQSLMNGWNMVTPYYGYFADYVTYRCWSTLEETELAQPYLQSWLNGLQLMQKGLNKQPDFNPSFSGRRNQ